MDIVVFVDNCVTNQKNTLIGNAFDRVDNYFKDVRVGAHLLEIIAQPRIVDVEIAVEQCGGAVDRTSGKLQVATMGLDRFAFADDAAGDVLVAVTIFLALEINAWTNRMQKRFGARRIVDADEIDEFQRG